MSQTDPSLARQGAGAAGRYIVKKAAQKAVASIGSGPLLIAAGIVLLIVVMCGLSLTLVLFSVGGTDEKRIGWQGEISGYGVNAIPAKDIPIYKSAGEKYGVPWNLLAAIHRVETNFSQNVAVSSAGAIGPTQFMECSWLGWKYPQCSGLGNINVPMSVLSDPQKIAKYGGYGVDGNGDGEADPMNLKDAIYSTAHYLAANGAKNGHFEKAVFAYNHSQQYVRTVMDFADRYVKGYVAVGGHLTGSVKDMLEASRKWIGNSTYVFGGGRTQSQIHQGIFDCSSFVHWAFAQIGIKLGPLSSVSTDTLKHLGKPVDPSNLKPGDLVFFHTYKVEGHVGIYLGHHRFIGAQTSSGVAIENMNNPYWKKRFHGIVRRILSK